MDKVIYLLLFILFSMYFFKKREKLTDIDIGINNVVDNVYVIAIPKRINYMKKVMKHYGLRGEFIKTVMKNKLNTEDLINRNLLHPSYLMMEKNFKADKPWYTGLSMGRIACHLSHMKALKTFLNSTNKTCLIFEDDIKMLDKNKTINNFIESFRLLPKHWEYVNLGRCFDNCATQTVYNNRIVKSVSSLCRHAYIVNRSGAKKILDYCLPMKGYPGDHHYAEMVEKNLINGYSTKEQIFFQNREELGTTLGNKGQNLTCSTPF